jgi:hypothetical protein
MSDPFAAPEPSWWGKLSKQDKWGYGLIASGAAAAIGSGVMGLMASRSKSDYEDALNTEPGSRADIQSAHDDLQRNALVADVLLGTGLAAGTAGLVLVLIKKPVKESKQVQQAKLQVSLGPSSISAQGRF